MNSKLPTGSVCIDKTLKGGISSGLVTMVYGEPETGKTTFAMQCAASCAINCNLKTLFVDCDNTFATERLLQITQQNFNNVSERIMLVKPTDFEEQSALVEKLSDYASKGFGLVIIDTFNSLYRVKISEVSPKSAFAVNRELNRQMAVLAQDAKMMRIPIVVLSQVKAVFDDTFVSVAPVATRVLEFWADFTIALKPTFNQHIISATISEKNRNPQEATCYLRLDQTGIHDIE